MRELRRWAKPALDRIELADQRVCRSRERLGADRRRRRIEIIGQLQACLRLPGVVLAERLRLPLDLLTLVAIEIGGGKYVPP
jgi:hypothetical protein